ncbi:MAG: hypothetical protein JSW27_04290 [Phycisphaerales bacterium]|nr:MAG: hypothetical protein JSW27_04290 [Phycisphaerales bacterium]
MNVTKHTSLKVAFLLAVVGAISWSVTGVDAASADNHAGAKAGKVSLDVIHGKQLPAVEAAVQKAIGHIEAGRSQAALAELKRVKIALASVHKALGQHVQPKFANTLCPIMGAPINPEKVAANLVREYNGQKVAFCCAGCPAAWDQLSATDKAAKLKKAGAQTQQNHSQHQH